MDPRADGDCMAELSALSALSPFPDALPAGSVSFRNRTNGSVVSDGERKDGIGVQITAKTF